LGKKEFEGYRVVLHTSTEIIFLKRLVGRSSDGYSSPKGRAPLIGKRGGNTGKW